MSIHNKINWDKAKQLLDTYLTNYKTCSFRANFPVCDIVDYINDIFGEWVDIDSNNSGLCHDMWFTWENNSKEKFTITLCTYHGDIELQEIEK